MAAIGCLLPFVLLLAGAAVGGISGGGTDSLWGGGIGLVLGLVGMALVLRVFERARNRWPG
jgi:hypothetical protein